MTRSPWGNLLVAVLLVWSSQVSLAEDKKAKAIAEWKSSVCVSPPGGFPMLGPASLTYTVSWNGVLKAGHAKILFAPGQEGTIETRGTSRSTGAARVLWPYDATVASSVHAERLLPLKVEQWEEDREEENVYRTLFAEGEVESFWTTKPKKDGKPDEDRRRVFAHYPVHDLVSGMLYLRSLPWEKGAKPVSIIVFPFRDPYLVTASLLGREKRTRAGEGVQALKFDLRISKICKNGKLEPISKQMKSAHFWITDDAQRLPLEMRAEIFVGSIRVTLTDFQQISSEHLQPVLASGGATEADWQEVWSEVTGAAKKWMGK